MVEAVIFDMDGLLIDSEAATYAIYKNVFAKHGKAFDHGFYLSLLGTNEKHIKLQLGEYLDDRNLALAIIKEVHELLEKEFITKGVPVKPGAYELLNYLKGKGIKLGVATSSSRMRAERILKNSQLLSYFDSLVCGDEVAHSKPHPEIFNVSRRKLKVDTRRTYVIEDSENGIVGAHAGGFRCIHVPDLKPTTEKIRNRANFIAQDLLQVIQYFDCMI